VCWFTNIDVGVVRRNSNNKIVDLGMWVLESLQDRLGCMAIGCQSVYLDLESSKPLLICFSQLVGWVALERTSGKLHIQVTPNP
jgi:hypothetical protein